jgi:hypothetical protein
MSEKVLSTALCGQTQPNFPKQLRFVPTVRKTCVTVTEVSAIFKLEITFSRLDLFFWKVHVLRLKEVSHVGQFTSLLHLAIFPEKVYFFKRNISSRQSNFK